MGGGARRADCEERIGDARRGRERSACGRLREGSPGADSGQSDGTGRKGSPCEPDLGGECTVQGGTAGTRAENSAGSTATTVFSFSRTLTRTSLVRSRSMFIRYASQRANFGARRQRKKILCMWIYGMTTLSQPQPLREPEKLAALPQIPRDEGGPVFAEPWQAQAFALAVRLSEQG